MEAKTPPRSKVSLDVHPQIARTIKMRAVQQGKRYCQVLHEILCKAMGLDHLIDAPVGTKRR